jgi:hypothetical protein
MFHPVGWQRRLEQKGDKEIKTSYIKPAISFHARSLQRSQRNQVERLLSFLGELCVFA